MSWPILRVGLTGGIASGKTTVGNRLSELGAFVIDADGLAHKLMMRGQAAYAPVVSEFGDAILSEDGQIFDRGYAALTRSRPDRGWLKLDAYNPQPTIYRLWSSMIPIR